MAIAFTRNEACVVGGEESVAALEREHNLKLPSDYRAFILNSPGGSPTADWSAFGRDGDFVAFVYGMHNGEKWKQLSYAIAEFGHDLSVFLPVAVSNGGNYFLLRLTDPDRGAIYFWDHELEGFRPPTFDSIIRVSNSFPEWLESLREPPD